MPADNARQRQAALGHSPGHGKGSEFVSRTPPRRILVIEDNADVAESLRFLLEADGHDVVVAQNGAAGVEAAQALHPDIVLCDIGLPGGMDGFDVARAVRQHPSNAAIYLVALSGYGEEEYQRQAREAGFDLYLVKPVDPSRLDQVLANLPDASTSAD